MAPLRRYLRITKYSVLECRIYVDNPALVHSWLLHPRDPVLPRVIESVRPLVLPKLMEERDRASKKGTSKKQKGAIRDVLVESDFEVSLFLVETNTRHSLLYKHRRARDKTQTRLVSNSSKMTGGGSGGSGGSGADAPIDVDAQGLTVELGADEAGAEDDDDDIVLTAGTGPTAATGQTEPPPNLVLEDSDDDKDGGGLQAIPDINETADAKDGAAGQRRSKRQRRPSRPVSVADSDDSGSLFMSNDDNDDDNDNGDDDDDAQPARKRPRVPVDPVAEAAADEDRKKKKLAMDVIYEGFAIYGRVLCLVVKQRGVVARGRNVQTVLPSPSASAATAAAASTAASSASSASAPAKPGGQAAMENWIASTQAVDDG